MAGGDFTASMTEDSRLIQYILAALGRAVRKFWRGRKRKGPALLAGPLIDVRILTRGREIGS
jgi:hypothetical protein